MARSDDQSRPVIRAPRGSELSAKSWLTEAPMRMLMNNLDPEVAERPEDLVVYGGIGKAARNWECYDAIVAALTVLGNDETLLVQSGKPVGVFRTHEQRLVGFQALEGGDDGVVALPVARGLADAAVHDELLRPLRNLGVEVVHEHAQRGLDLPIGAAHFCASRSADRSGGVEGGGHEHGFYAAARCQ